MFVALICIKKIILKKNLNKIKCFFILPGFLVALLQILFDLLLKSFYSKFSSLI